jgi:CheY-like chemotaxis protein
VSGTTDAAGRLRPVLVVDDDEDVRDVVATVLDDAGFTVALAGDGREALRRLREEGVTPCLILLDLMMPVMDGWEFRRRQLQDRRFSRIPVVISTAVPESVTRELAPHAVIPKPCDLDRLLSVVDALR